MKASELIEKATSLTNTKTMYLQGASGQRLTKANQLKFAGSTFFNSARSKQIYASDENTRAFDVPGFAGYLFGEKIGNVGEALSKCIDISKDFSTIVPGEMVFAKDRVGLFTGSKKVITVNENGVVFVDLDGWASHGKLASVDYAGPAIETIKLEKEVEVETIEAEPEKVEDPVVSEEPVKEIKHEESEQRQERRVDFRHDRGRNRH